MNEWDMGKINRIIKVGIASGIKLGLLVLLSFGVSSAQTDELSNKLTMLEGAEEMLLDMEGLLLDTKLLAQQGLQLSDLVISQCIENQIGSITRLFAKASAFASQLAPSLEGDDVEESKSLYRKMKAVKMIIVGNAEDALNCFSQAHAIVDTSKQMLPITTNQQVAISREPTSISNQVSRVTNEPPVTARVSIPDKTIPTIKTPWLKSVDPWISEDPREVLGRNVQIADWYIKDNPKSGWIRIAGLKAYSKNPGPSAAWELSARYHEEWERLMIESFERLHQLQSEDQNLILKLGGDQHQAEQKILRIQAEVPAHENIVAWFMWNSESISNQLANAIIFTPLGMYGIHAALGENGEVLEGTGKRFFVSVSDYNQFILLLANQQFASLVLPGNQRIDFRTLPTDLLYQTFTTLMSSANIYALANRRKDQLAKQEYTLPLDHGFGSVPWGSSPPYAHTRLLSKFALGYEEIFGLSSASNTFHYRSAWNSYESDDYLHPWLSKRIETPRSLKDMEYCWGIQLDYPLYAFRFREGEVINHYFFYDDELYAVHKRFGDALYTDGLEILRGLIRKYGMPSEKTSIQCDASGSKPGPQSWTRYHWWNDTAGILALVFDHEKPQGPYLLDPETRTADGINNYVAEVVAYSMPIRRMIEDGVASVNPMELFLPQEVNPVQQPAKKSEIP